MCVFCMIASGESRASFLHQDEQCLAFMNIRPINPGEFMVIPRKHVDHFTDLPDALACHILTVAQRLGRNLLRELKPLRIGYVVHGFGVAHAHLNVVPLHTSSDIISAKHVVLTDEGFAVSLANLPVPDRSELDLLAQRLA
ncbi:HIT family protein [Tabrizicola sp.]|uniref:HIT family protein n=1 Tax=Tabrizicola sp. TaxID=2005166 RepID=UPI003F2ED441